MDSKIRNAKTTGRKYKLYDGKGLFLLVTETGQKGWRFKYRFDCKEKQLSFGTFPDVGLKEARRLCCEARKLITDGVNPSDQRKKEKLARAEADVNTFEAVFREWYPKNHADKNPKYAAQILSTYERDILPAIGLIPIADVKPIDVLRVLQKIEGRGALTTAHRIQYKISQQMRYAVATCRAERDITCDLRGALPPVTVKHHAAITEPEKLAGLLRAVDGDDCLKVTRCALQLTPLLFLRPNELRKGEWGEIDFDNSIWNIPACRMKTKKEHIVPLSRQAVAIFKELEKLTGDGRFLFPSIRSRSAGTISENTLNAAYRRLGYSSEEVTAHGFRATARTMLDEVLEFRIDHIEHQLAHVVRDTNGAAYNRTKHLSKRKEMMQTWSDYLDNLKNEVGVAPRPSHGV
jgi:integrase